MENPIFSGMGRTINNNKTKSAASFSLSAHFLTVSTIFLLSIFTALTHFADFILLSHFPYYHVSSLSPVYIPLSDVSCVLSCDWCCNGKKKSWSSYNRNTLTKCNNYERFISYKSSSQFNSDRVWTSTN